MDILRALHHWAVRIPDRPALRDAAGDLTWRQLRSAAGHEAALVSGRGVAPGERVGVLMHNSTQFAIAVLAGLGAGAIVVPINHRLHPGEMAKQLRDAEVRLLFHDQAHQQVGAELGESLGIPTELLGPDRAYPATLATEPWRPRELDDIAFILYSSGTTGRPRGAAISHGSIMWMAHDRMVNDNWSNETITYVPYPLAFAGGLLACWIATMVAGGLTVLEAEFDAERAIRRFTEDRITVFMGVPALWQAIEAHPALEHADVSSLRTVSAGGAVVSTDLMRRLRERGIRLAQGYGLTECSAVATHLSAEDIERKPGSIGRPMMMMETRVVTPEGVRCAPGEPGELHLRGPAVMSGYWRDGAPDPSTLDEGWLRTGDLVVEDEEGFLTVVDRLKDLIITGGINVAPAEIEQAIEEIPGVRECAVVGVPHQRWGETPHAFVVTEEPMSSADIEAALRDRLAGFKIPSVIEVRSAALPRSVNGKILRRALRDQVLGDPVSDGQVSGEQDQSRR